jgi:hypothetical protein
MNINSPTAGQQPGSGGPLRKTSLPPGTGQQRPVLQAKLTPAEQEKENKRVAALFQLNSELLRAAAHLQAEGRGKHPGKQSGGQTSPTTSEPGKEGEEGEKKSISSPEYVEYVLPFNHYLPLRC